MTTLHSIDPVFIQGILRKIREGFVLAINREVERCRVAGLPIYVARDGQIEMVMPDGTTRPVERRPE